MRENVAFGLSCWRAECVRLAVRFGRNRRSRALWDKACCRNLIAAMKGIGGQSWRQELEMARERTESGQIEILSTLSRCLLAIAFGYRESVLDEVRMGIAQ